MAIMDALLNYPERGNEGVDSHQPGNITDCHSLQPSSSSAFLATVVPVRMLLCSLLHTLTSLSPVSLHAVHLTLWSTGDRSALRLPRMGLAGESLFQSPRSIGSILGQVSDSHVDLHFQYKTQEYLFSQAVGDPIQSWEIPGILGHRTHGSSLLFIVYHVLWLSVNEVYYSIIYITCSNLTVVKLQSPKSSKALLDSPRPVTIKSLSTYQYIPCRVVQSHWRLFPIGPSPYPEHYEPEIS